MDLGYQDLPGKKKAGNKKYYYDCISTSSFFLTSVTSVTSVTESVAELPSPVAAAGFGPWPDNAGIGRE